MTDEEKIKKLEKQIEDLQFHVEEDDKYYAKLELDYVDLQVKYNESLKDPYNFIRCCEQRNELDKDKQLRWTQDQKDFLEEYLHYFND